MEKRNQNKKQVGRVPLERALSKLGFASRTEAKALIESGRVKVHGSLESNPKRMVNPNTSHIEVDGKKTEKAETRLFLFHKPKGVVTTKRDPEGRKTIYDFLPAELHSFHAVGRLDMHTTGLLLLTNDTRLSNHLTDPQSEIPRSYVVEVRGEVLDESLQKMTKGVEDEGEILKAISAEIIKRSGKETRLKLVLCEGKNREIRRLCQKLGHEVETLKRVSFGEYDLGQLKPGELQEVYSTKKV